MFEKRYGVAEWIREEDGAWRGTIIYSGLTRHEANRACRKTNQFVKRLGVSWIKYNVCEGLDVTE